jgi:hypothetical protein
MAYTDLFVWWAATISAGSLFLVAVSMYLFLGSLKKQGGAAGQTNWSIFRIGVSFTFVWALLGLLVLYLVSVNRGSSILFAGGNILFEAILILYVLKNRTRAEQADTVPAPAKNQ